MMVTSCKTTEVSRYLPKYGIIFLFLAVFVFMFLIYSMDILEFQHKNNSTIITPRVSTDPYMHHGICTFQPQSPEDALEERLLLESIAWPETPALPDPVSLEQTSDPAHSNFTIFPRRGGGQWHVGDQLEVMIQMCDFRGRAKRSGGDFLIARLHNKALGAGVAGEVVDHLNGSYSVVFSLLWEGSAEVEVTLVHPSEAIMVLRRLNREHPDRVYFKSLFRSGSVSETTTCNWCLRPTQQPLCNYTDPHTGESWFCFKPKNLSCNTRIDHFLGVITKNLKANEEKFFQSRVNMKVSIRASGPAAVTVLRNKTGQPEMNNNRVMFTPSGYYYQGVWRALGGTTVHQFNTPSAVSQCLKGKMVHLYGDSTVRQWFHYLTSTLPDLKEFNLYSISQSGPFMSLDPTNNIMVTYNCHGLPLRFAKVPFAQLRYIANELDGLTGGTHTVVVVSVWAHFCTFPIEMYIRRLQNIRRAVVRLLDRAPGTLVIIRTANLRALNLDVALVNSDWYSLQTDKVLRAMFKGLNVHLVDAWQMSLAHHVPHDIHPLPPVVKNMIDVLLSYICPQNGG